MKVSGNNVSNNKSSKKGYFSPLQLILIAVSLAVVGLLLYKVFSASPANNSAKTNNPQNSSQTPPTEAVSKLYLSPSSQNLASGAQITVEIREDSGNTPVNAVQANFSYPADKLTFVSIDYSGSGFDVQAQEKTETGQILIGRGSFEAKTGDQLIAKVNFQAASGPTSAELKFQAGSSLISATTHKDTLSSDSSKGAVYTIQ